MGLRIELPCPANWQDFEVFCRDLFAAEWADPEAKLHGRSGQADHGVDVFGRRGRRWMGVQCKRRRQFPEAKLTERQIRDEVEAAKGFPSRLDTLIVATTAPADTAFDRIANLLTEEAAFRVVVYGWEELVEKLQHHPQVLDRWQRKLLGARVARPLHLPFPPLGDLLKGREGELDLLASGLEKKPAGAFAVVQQPEAVHGLGGVGKTALAVEHAWQCRERYSGVFFVRAESPGLLQAGLAELGPKLGFEDLEDEDATVQSVLRWLQDNPGWLLILDNVDDEQARRAATALLPRLSAGRVLLTSRYQSWSGRVKRVPLDVLDAEEAVAFLDERAAQRSVTADDEAQARKLAGDLGNLPLALEQAAAFVDVHGESWAAYRRRLKDESAEVLSWYDPEVMDYPRSIAATWQTTFDALGRSAQTLLHVMACLAPDAIPRLLFDGAASSPILESAARQLEGEAELGDLDVSGAVRELVSYSLAQATAEGLSVHRMVQAVVRSRLDPEGLEGWLETSIELLLAVKPGDGMDVRTWKQWEPLRPHALRVFRHADETGLVTTALAVLLDSTATYLHAGALHAEAEPLMRRALSIDETSYGADHPKVAIDLNNLAQLLQATNRLSEAEPLMRRALLIDETSYGADHPKVAIRLNNLAQLLQDTNLVEEAVPLVQRAVQILEASLVEGHPQLERARANLAAMLAARDE